MIGSYRILLSYHYFRKVDLGEMIARRFKVKPVLFADSGAYSAVTQGAAIDRRLYAGWLIRNKRWISLAANLDVIGDAKASLDNWRFLQEQGLRPVPVFHAGEPWDYLDRYLGEGCELVALGGLVKSGSTRELLTFTEACFDRRERGGYRSAFHGFGVTAADVALALPWFSVDSSTHSYAFRNRALPVFDRLAGRMRTVAFKRDRAKLLRNLDKLGRLAGDAEAFDDDWRFLIRYGMASYYELEQAMRDRHGEVPGPAWLPFKGPAIFFAHDEKYRSGFGSILLADTLAGRSRPLAFTPKG